MSFINVDTDELEFDNIRNYRYATNGVILLDGARTVSKNTAAPVIDAGKKTRQQQPKKTFTFRPGKK